MKVLLTAQPNLAHWHPLVPLSQPLADAGHGVAVAAAPSFSRRIEANGFPSSPVGLNSKAKEPQERRFIFAQSVFSHLYPHERDVMPTLARPRIRDTGRLVFTPFLTNEIVTFEDRFADPPMTGFTTVPTTCAHSRTRPCWEVVRAIPPSEPRFGQGKQDTFVCRPVEPAKLLPASDDRDVLACLNQEPTP